MTRQLEPRQFGETEEIAASAATDLDPRQEALRRAAQGPLEPDDLQAVFDVPVKVQAVLGRSRMDIGELLQLKPGMVVELDRRVGEPADIFVNNRLIARGEVVLIDNALGVTPTEIVRQEG